MRVLVVGITLVGLLIKHLTKLLIRAFAFNLVYYFYF